MATSDLGRVTPLWKGTYDAATPYELNDLVLYSGSVYWHKGETTTTGTAPTDTSVWGLVVDGSAIPGLVATATAAKNDAVDAKAAAQTAQTAAETAQGKAETAQGKAETAQGKAEDAQGAAETAQAAAEAAQTAAEEAGYLTDARDNTQYSMAWGVNASGFPTLTLTPVE